MIFSEESGTTTSTGSTITTLLLERKSRIVLSKREQCSRSLLLLVVVEVTETIFCSKRLFLYMKTSTSYIPLNIYFRNNTMNLEKRFNFVSTIVNDKREVT
jgi:hypothetical protein